MRGGRDEDSIQQDNKEKKALFIESSVKVREGFFFVHPFEQITAVKKYCTATCASNLWQQDIVEITMLIN